MKTEHTYLGIILQNIMSWASHIVKKASRTLNFLKCNLSSCSQKVTESAYFTIVRPILEYGSINCLGPIPSSTYQLVGKCTKEKCKMGM